MNFWDRLFGPKRTTCPTCEPDHADGPVAHEAEAAEYDQRIRKNRLADLEAELRLIQRLQEHNQ